MWATMAFADPDGVLDPGPPVLLSSCSPVPVLLSSCPPGPPVLLSSCPPILGVGGMRGAFEYSPQPVRLMVVILNIDQNRNYVQDAEVLPPPPLRRPGTFRRSLKKSVSEDKLFLK
jgi:hypothetical protein